MRRPSPVSLAAAALLVASLLLPGPADAKTRRKRKVRRAKPTPVTRPYYGPPAPMPEPYLRAAGACMEYLPGEYLVVAEVGATGRVFRVDTGTRIEADVRKGARVRVLYEEGAGGPVARRVLPGPAPGAPTPSRAP
jgi:hypothetical protein